MPTDDDESWATLAIGDELTIVKLAPDGAEVARYAGTVTARQEPGSWVVVQAIWTSREVDVEGLTFAPGDMLVEWFTPRHDFNAFAVHAADGEFRGWYANVAHPTMLDTGASPPTLAWRDLYLDVISLPNGAPIVCDEDELTASGLMQRDPSLFERILRTRDEIVDRLERRIIPFEVGRDPAS